MSDLMRQIEQEYTNGMAYKQGRVKDWQESEDLLFGRTKKSIKGRSNIPLPVMSGFVNTLLSKIDEAPSLKFGPVEESDTRSAGMVQGQYEIISKDSDADWETKDIDGKKLNTIYGRTIYKAYGERSPKFKFNLFVTDPYDFYVDPMGGGDLEDAKYCGEDCIWRNKKQLIDGAKAKIYDSASVRKVLEYLAGNKTLSNDTQENSKSNRFAALGLNNQMYNYAGEGALRFVESGTMKNGVRTYVFWHFDSKTIIREAPLKEVFASELWHWTSWASYRDKFNFWSMAPADDMRPIAVAMQILANQELDNRQKTNWNQRAYDPDMFEDPQELEYRPNGLVAVKSGTWKIQPIANGIYNFQTPQLSGTINLVNWLDQIAGTKTGITASAQGSSNEQKVGIYEGNLQQVADRLGLINKSYSKCWTAIGRRFVWALKENMPPKLAVRMLGAKGVEWQNLFKKDINPLMNISVSGGSAQIALDANAKQSKEKALTLLLQSPNATKWEKENILRFGGFTEEQIREALDTESYENRDSLLHAAESIDKIVNGETPKLFRGANTAFQQKILDFAYDNTDEDLPLFQALTAYAGAHDELVMENMTREAMKVAKTAQMAPGGMQQPAQPAMQPVMA
jgi:hypothetical protein